LRLGEEKKRRRRRKKKKKQDENIYGLPYYIGQTINKIKQDVNETV